MVSLRSPQALLRPLPFYLPSSSFPSKPSRLKKLHNCFPPSSLRLLNCSQKVRSSISPEAEKNSISEIQIEDDRRPFDLNLAVVLAGFAFEAYTTPPKDVGWREMDAAECQTVILSESFLREVYEGQLFVKLKKGVDFPATDPWGTSDPYVVIQLDGQVARARTKEPVWNEDFTLNMKNGPNKVLQVAAWDANLLTPPKRLGNAGVDINSLCDGNLHELDIKLEGIGGGGKISLEVKYKSYDQIEEEKQWWRLPLVADILTKGPLAGALKVALGSETVNVRQFVESAFGQLKLFNYNDLKKLPPRVVGGDARGTEENLTMISGLKKTSQQENNQESPEQNQHLGKHGILSMSSVDSNRSTLLGEKLERSISPDEYFWKSLSEIVNQSALQKLGVSIPDNIRWDRFDFLNKFSKQSQKIAEAGYVESGLATAECEDEDCNKSDQLSNTVKKLPSLSDVRKVSRDVLNQTEMIFGALVVLGLTLSQQRKSLTVDGKDMETAPDKGADANREHLSNGSGGAAIEKLSSLNDQKVAEMRELFLSAESTMEAWAMLATSLGRPSFIKSEFEKIVFLDNISTDTQVAIWRDSLRRRLVISFRGTEKTRWKDLLTDIMLVPAGLNPERLGGDFKQELQVHSGFLGAYDSVRNRILTLIKLAIGLFEENGAQNFPRWHVFVTGHSLGGALATLLALELSSSNMAKSGAISVTMYNFGSPRVGNKRFSEVYNKKVRDSWRVVNHRDIIPTVPRLMGYCHVAQPVYLSAGDLSEPLVNREGSEDGYQGDVIGESTPDVLVSEFMKGEKQLVEKILQTEINLLRSIRDGTALMQHMEDFYYIALLESARSNYSSNESTNTIDSSSNA